MFCPSENCVLDFQFNVILYFANSIRKNTIHNVSILWKPTISAPQHNNWTNTSLFQGTILHILWNYISDLHILPSTESSLFNVLLPRHLSDIDSAICYRLLAFCVLLKIIISYHFLPHLHLLFCFWRSNPIRLSSKKWLMEESLYAIYHMTLRWENGIYSLTSRKHYNCAFVFNAVVETYEIAETLPAPGLQENLRNWYN